MKIQSLLCRCLMSAAFTFGLCVAIQAGETNTPIPWSEIGAKAGADYKGDGLSVTASERGARLRCVFQKLEGEATSDGLWLTSTAPDAVSDRFQVVASAVGRQPGGSLTLAARGTVTVTDGLASLMRPGLREEYTVSMDGVRQDFVVIQRPEGEGELKLKLEVRGALVEQTPYGAKLVLKKSGREIAYSRLRVTDAKGKELPARIEVAHIMTVAVNDTDAVYPVRIDPTFSDANWISMGGIPGANSVVRAAAVDGSGNLYIGGSFFIVGETNVSAVAKWDGNKWSALGLGVNSTVYAMAVSGSDVYAGGDFTTAGGSAANRIAKWNGSSWSALGSGMNSTVRALAVSGSDVYAGGDFTTAGGSAASRIAKWNGSSWSALGLGMNNTVRALAVSGSELFAGGSFTVVTNGGPTAVTVNYVARWDGSSWSALGSGMNGQVYGVAISGSDLYAGGDFTLATNAGPVALTVNRIARWDGSNWSALGSGVNNSVFTVAVSGSDVYAGGSFTTAGGSGATNIAKWNGGSWSALGSGTEGGSFGAPLALAVSGSDLFVGGSFDMVNLGTAPVGARHIAKWNGSSWSTLGSGMNQIVEALAVSGSDVYAGGQFITVGGITANRVAKWDGSSWSALSSGMNSSVSALAVSGSDLYAGGSFTNAGGVAANRVAKWDGSSWSALGSGLGGNVNALAVAGGNVYAGGQFGISRWNGSTWSSLGSGVNDTVYALASLGTDVYVGGAFTTAGGTSAFCIAKWDGTSWSTLGSGCSSIVFGLTTSGNDVYAGGDFTVAGGITVNRIAKWDGSNWSALGSGFAFGTRVYALQVSGSDVYAGLSGGGNIAKWNGSAWSGLGSGVGSVVFSLALSGTNLYAGGAFTSAGGKVSGYMARALINLAPTNFTLSADTLAENQAAGTLVGYFTGEDPDAGDTHTFTLVSGTGSTDNSSFSVANGTNLVTAAVLDYETKSNYSIRVRATDPGNSIYEKVFTINVTDTVIEPATNITMNTSSVGENQSAGTLVGYLIAEDPNAGDTHTFTLVSGTGGTDNSSFSISNGTNLLTAVIFNFETKSSYSIRVRATDQTGLTFEKALTISVTNVNEAPNNITLNGSVLAENQPIGTQVGTFTASDVDAGNTHVFTLVSGSGSTDNGSFGIGNDTNLLTAAVLNFEAKSLYSIRVRATDQGGLTFDRVFTITVTNLNEAPTNITLSATNVGENLSVGTKVGHLIGQDPDAASAHTFALVSGAGDADNASFSLGSNTNLLTAEAFDFETKNSYSLRVRATDGGGLTFEKAFTVTVANVNESPTNIIISVSEVGENQPAGTKVGHFAGQDPDANNTHTATLVSGTGSADNTSFSISNGTNLLTAAMFNFEAKDSYSIRVRAVDQGGLSFEKVFTITVTNVNEAPTANAGGHYTNVFGNTLNLNGSGSSDPDAGDSIASYEWDLNNDGGFGDVAGVSPAVAPGTLSGLGLVAGTQTIQLRVTDTFGLKHTNATTLTIVDVTSPTITCPSNLTVQCDADVPLANFAGGTASDNLDATPTVTHVGDVSNGTCPKTITRTYRATDDSGNTNECAQIITVQDTIAPVLVGVPGNQSFECLGDVPTPATVTATDNCDTNVAVTLTSTTNGTCPTIIIHTWTATDACTNSVSASQTNIVLDTTAPVLVGVPANQSYQCLADVPAPAAVTATDNCDTNVVVTVSSTTNGTCPMIIIHAWTATDACTNSASASQTNIVLDTTAPLLVGVPGNQSFECLGDVPTPATVTATDNCDTNFAVTLTSTTNGTCPTIIIHTWTATDACTNSVSASQTNIVLDTAAPVLVGVPANQSYQCLEDVPAPAAVTATDNCDTNVVVTVVSTTNGTCPMIIIHAWTATDACTNSASASQTNIVLDTIAPLLVGAPTNENYQCLTDVPAPAIVSATDNCDTNVVVTVSSMTNGTCPTVIIHTWTATDACTNSGSVSQTNTVEDTIAPVIDCPTNMVVHCTGTNGAVVNFSVTATDNCDTNVATTCTPPSGSVFHEGTNVVTCAAVDDCGNTNTCTFMIRVDDPAGPPTLSITRQGADIVICWPESCTSYELEQTTELPAVTWTPAGGTLTISGGQYCVTLPISSSNQFFRLKKL